jgi:hypothetical protein
MVELRRQGYSYAAIAEVLASEGLTEGEVSRQFVNKVIRREAPELTGNVRRKLGLAKMVRKMADDASAN